jgi:hypothetical protein
MHNPFDRTPSVSLIRGIVEDARQTSLSFDVLLAAPMEPTLVVPFLRSAQRLGRSVATLREPGGGYWVAQGWKLEAFGLIRAIANEVDLLLAQLKLTDLRADAWLRVADPATVEANPASCFIPWSGASSANGLLEVVRRISRQAAFLDSAASSPETPERSRPFQPLGPDEAKSRQKICEAWDSRPKGTRKEQFADDRNISVERVDQCLDWNAKQRKRRRGTNHR